MLALALFVWYLFLFLMTCPALTVIIRSNGFKSQTPYCRYSNESNETTNMDAKCYHINDIKAFNVSYYIPMTNLSTQISSLTLQTAFAPDLKWHIDRLDYFSRFEELLTLRVYGPMTFAENLQLETLRENLFNVPSLQTLYLFNNKFSGYDYTWELPPGLRNLTVIFNDYTEFNLVRNPNLVAINFQQTNLASMPRLSQPPPPLTAVDFQNNRLLEITADDLAWFCQANTMHFDGNNLQKSDQYCECTRIKNWMKHVLQQPEEKIFNKTLTCNASNNKCENYTLDKAIQNREACLMAKLSEIDEEYRAGAATPFSMQFYLIFGGLMVVLATFGLVAFVTYQYIRAAPTELIQAERKLNDNVRPKYGDHHDSDDDGGGGGGRNDDDDDDGEGSGNDDEHEENEPIEYNEYKQIIIS